MWPRGLEDFALSESGKEQFTNSVCVDKLSQPPMSFQINIILHESF